MGRALNGSSVELKFADPRRMKPHLDNKVYTAIVGSRTVYTSNGAGTTTTIVGAVPAPATNDNNVIRRGERFKLFTSAGVLKEETVFEVTNITAAGGSVTFAPAAAVATASGDFAKLVGTYDFDDEEALDSALAAFSATVYSPVRLREMTIKDKVFAFRQNYDPKGVK